MNTITRTFIEDALTSFIGKLENEGYALYMYDQFEDEDIVCDTHGELAKELLGEDLTHLIIENQNQKHTVVALIPENREDLITDWAPFHCHNDKFIVDNLEAFSEYLYENLNGS